MEIHFLVSYYTRHDVTKMFFVILHLIVDLPLLQSKLFIGC